MKSLRALLCAVSLAVCLLPKTAFSACYSDVISARLSNFCALDKLKTAKTDVRTLQLVDYRLKREGFQRGLGLPTRIKFHSTSKALYPILSYSDNINGGNSPEPLVIGSLSFDGDEALFRKAGLMAGFGAGLGGRYIHAEGKYFTYGASASYSHSSEHGLGITTTSANMSSINHIRDWWFVDAHVNTSRVRKNIADETNSNISLLSSKVYESADGRYGEASLGLNRYFAENYNQNQLLLGYKTIHANSVYSSVSLIIGESVDNQLATKFALSGQVITQLAKKPLKLSASYSQADGGMLLGVDRGETTVAVSASYPVWRNLTVNVGYRNTNSSIDYFDISTPTLGLQFAAFQF